MVILKNDILTAAIHPFGARLAHIGFLNGPNLVLDADPEVYPDWAACYGGVIVGPVANRVSNAQAQIDGVAYQMEANEGPNCLHSGSDGVHACLWSVCDETKTSATLTLTLPDGACGLPGTRRITACFALDANALDLTLIAKTDKATLMALAHHPYWPVSYTHLTLPTIA